MGRSQDKEPDGNILEIKNQGDTVFIRTVPNITIRDYAKGQDMVIENPDSDKVGFNIDKAKYFAFICDDIDKHQSDIGLMDSWSDDGGEQMQIEIDSGILSDIYDDADSDNMGTTAGAISGSFDLGTTAASEAITKVNVLDYLVDVGTVLDEQNIPNQNRWGVIPAWFSGLIKKSDQEEVPCVGNNTVH